MFPKTTDGSACLWRKIRAFRSFQTSQEVRRTTDPRAFRFGVEAPVMRLHHSWRDIASHVWSSIEYKPSHSLIRPQSLWVKRQWTKRWSMDSALLMHRGQLPQLGQPFFCKRFAVQSLFWRASQAKNLTFGGTQMFQMVLLKSRFIINHVCLRCRAVFKKFAGLGEMQNRALLWPLRTWRW
jgi:hypothetical protein